MKLWSDPFLTYPSSFCCWWMGELSTSFVSPKYARCVGWSRRGEKYHDNDADGDDHAHDNGIGIANGNVTRVVCCGIAIDGRRRVCFDVLPCF